MAHSDVGKFRYCDIELSIFIFQFDKKEFFPHMSTFGQSAFLLGNYQLSKQN